MSSGTAQPMTNTSQARGRGGRSGKYTAGLGGKQEGNCHAKQRAARRVLRSAMDLCRQKKKKKMYVKSGSWSLGTFFCTGRKRQSVKRDKEGAMQVLAQRLAHPLEIADGIRQEHSVAQRSTAQHSTAQHSTVLSDLAWSGAIRCLHVVPLRWHSITVWSGLACVCAGARAAVTE
jgi:hypothetical protein